MLIPFDQPLDLASTFDSGQAFRWIRVGPAGSKQWFSGVLFNNALTIRGVSGGIEFCSKPEKEESLAPAVRDYLRLDDPLEAICRSINVDGHIEAAITQYKGMRILRQDPWECLVAFVCSANSNVRRISTNVEDMARSLGRRVEAEGAGRHIFPGPSELAAAGEDRLRGLGLGFHAKYVATIAESVARGEVDLFALREAPYEVGLEVLTSLLGVGDKIANCVLLFALDKLEAFPVDVWIRRVLQEWYHVDAKEKLSDWDKRLWAQDYFGRHAGYANQYLFHRRRLLGRT